MTTSASGTTGIVTPSGGVLNTTNPLVGTTDAQTITNKEIDLPASTTSSSPLQLTAGSVLTTPTAGFVEYDGDVFYLTLPSSRGFVPACTTIALRSNITGTATTSAQSIFGTLSTWTVADIDSAYMFKMNVVLAHTTGTASHSINLLFGGTATVSKIFYRGSVQTNNSTDSFNGFSSTLSQVVGNSVSATTASGAFTIASTNWAATVVGVVKFSAVGTFIPQFSVSSALVYITQAGSSISIWPIGAQGTVGTSVRVGNWTN